MSTRADRVKARNVLADGRASLYVEGPDRWSFVVAEGEAEVSAVSTEPGDATGRELLTIFPQPDPAAEAAFLADAGRRAARRDPPPRATPLRRHHRARSGVLISGGTVGSTGREGSIVKSPWKWTSQLETEREYLVLASSIPPLSRRSTWRLFRGSGVVRKQLSGTDGVMGFALLARPMRKQYATLSVWRDEAALAGVRRHRATPSADERAQARDGSDQVRAMDDPRGDRVGRRGTTRCNAWADDASAGIPSSR